MNDKQRESLKNLCERYDVKFEEAHYPDCGGLNGLPKDYVSGWVGGEVGKRIYIGCSPEGHFIS